MQKPETVTIAGAGLAGSLLGVMLGQRGYKVDIYERRADMRRQDIESGRSINLALSERGIHALKLAGLMDEVEKLLIPMRGRMIHDLSGGTELQPYGQQPHEVIYSVSRELLNSLMMTAAEVAPDVNVHFKTKCESVDLEKKSIAFVDEDTGARSETSYEILIGADGAGSRIRRHLIPANGGMSSSEFLDHDYKELEIPPAADGQHQIEREALHIWPRGGFMLIALPNLDGSFTVTLFMPKSGETSFASLNAPEDVREFFATHFPDALSLMPDVFEDYFQNPQGLLGTLRCSPWFYDESVLIVGDASHAIVPFHGQGMNAGFEDCSELIRLLDEFDDDWGQVLPEFDRIRRPCAEAIADMALENYVTMRDSVRDPKFQLKKEIGFALEQQFPDRFIPRYSMVMFHRIPYDQVLARGEIQGEILDELTQTAKGLEDVDMAAAARMVETRLSRLELELGASSSVE